MAGDSFDTPPVCCYGWWNRKRAWNIYSIIPGEAKYARHDALSSLGKAGDSKLCGTFCPYSREKPELLLVGFCFWPSLMAIDEQALKKGTKLLRVKKSMFGRKRTGFKWVRLSDDLTKVQ